MTTVVETKNDPSFTLAQRSATLHQVLAVVAFIALLLSAWPRLAAYQPLIVALCTAFGFGTFATCKAYMSPRQRAIAEQFSPTPNITDATKAVEVLP